MDPVDWCYWDEVNKTLQKILEEDKIKYETEIHPSLVISLTGTLE
jgi:hypothetical protein